MSWKSTHPRTSTHLPLLAQLPVWTMFIRMSAHQFHWMVSDTREYCVGLSTLKQWKTQCSCRFPFILLTIDQSLSLGGKNSLLLFHLLVCTFVSLYACTAVPDSVRQQYEDNCKWIREAGRQQLVGSTLWWLLGNSQSFFQTTYSLYWLDYNAVSHRIELASFLHLQCLVACSV